MRLRRPSTGPGHDLGSSRRRIWRVRVALLVPLAVTAVTVGGAGGFYASGAPGAETSAVPANAVPAQPLWRSCVATRLPALGGGHGNATAVSSNGLAVGIATDSRGRSRAVLWRSGRTIKIPAQLFGAVPTGVNRYGIVVGTAYQVGRDIPVGWWWVAGKSVHLLPVRRGEVAIPEAINDRGSVIGAIANDEEHAEGEVVDDVERAAYWPSVHREARQLGPLQGDEGAHAYAISNGGVIGGVSAGATFRPVTWDRLGRPTRLQTGGSRAGTVRGFARGGLPVGEAVLPGHGMTAVRWDGAGRAYPLGGERAVATLRFGSTSATGLPAAHVTKARIIDAVAVAAAAAGPGTLLVGYTVVSNGSRVATSWRCP
jgi:uncharacterized membrane protein